MWSFPGKESPRFKTFSEVNDNLNVNPHSIGRHLLSKWCLFYVFFSITNPPNNLWKIVLSWCAIKLKSLRRVSWPALFMSPSFSERLINLLMQFSKQGSNLSLNLGNNNTEDGLSNIPRVMLQTGMCSATRLIGNMSHQAPHVPSSSSPQCWEMRDERLLNPDLGLVALSTTVLFDAGERQLRRNLCVNR